MNVVEDMLQNKTVALMSVALIFLFIDYFVYLFTSGPSLL